MWQGRERFTTPAIPLTNIKQSGFPPSEPAAIDLFMHNGAGMRTELQREASRINGARSLGPVTNAGKRKSSRNSRTHCLYAKDSSISLMSSGPATADQPATSPGLEAQSPAPHTACSEHDLLTQAALDAYRDLKRIIGLETRLMNEEIARQRLIQPDETAATLIALAFRRLVDETGAIHALYRYEGVMQRRWERAVQRLNRHRPQPESVRETNENEIRETNLTGPLYGGLSLTGPLYGDLSLTGPLYGDLSLTCRRPSPSIIANSHTAPAKRAYNRRVAAKRVYVPAARWSAHSGLENAPKKYNERNNDEANPGRRLLGDCRHHSHGSRAGPHHETAHARSHSPGVK
jgi:hypothetical protein